ncbi:recombinase family protein [Daejeonella sp. JGW-45]|uniref:recombinase family protein n=1 Tax=Daejeonella sp. JGW-45 TaxID=3034148 RepID=UPI0023EB8591|nr:recombinase family protein [Daejeonella sp. JGW-45]
MKQERAVLYTRVSTDEQAKHGHSLPHQLEVLTRYCEIRNIEVVAHFQEDYSAKNFNRPEFIKMEKFVKANRKTINKVLVHKWDRFSRNVEEAFTQIRKFKEIGVEINSVESAVDFTNRDSKALLALHLVLPEIENDKNSDRTTEGSRKARRMGCWTGPPPFGYVNARDENNKSTLVPNEHAVLVKECFEQLATGLYSAEEIRKRYYNKGLKLQKQAFLNLIRNFAYTGKIFIKAWRDQPEEVVNGLHEGIVSEELFKTVQDRLDGRVKFRGIPSTKNERFPLRGYLKCNICESKLTGSRSKSRNGDYHYYYHCQNGCKERFRADIAHATFEEGLKRLQFSPEVRELFLQISKDLYQKNQGNVTNEVNKLLDEIKEKEILIESADDKYLKGELNKERYESAISRYQKIILENRVTIQELKAESTEIIKYLKYSSSLLTDIASHYENSSLEIKQKLIGSIFPEKLIFFENKYRTKRLNSVIGLITISNNAFEVEEPKKASSKAGLSTKAPEAGLEPATL